MARYKITTLVDITKSNANRSETDRIKLGQQANFNSLLQTIGLRSNVSWASDPKSQIGILPDPFQGKAACWQWEIDCERDDVFLKDGDPVGLLKDDLHGVPVVNDLDNTADIDPSIFDTKTQNYNTIIEVI
jgi:hypothetical protein